MPAIITPPAKPPFDYHRIGEFPADVFTITGHDDAGNKITIAENLPLRFASHLTWLLNKEPHDEHEDRERRQAEHKALDLWKEQQGEGDPRPDMGCCGQNYVPLLNWAMQEIDKLKACPARGLTRGERTTLDAGKPVEVIRMIQKRTGLTVAEAKVFLDKYRNEPRGYYDR
jgi:hypothetical protein